MVIWDGGSIHTGEAVRRVLERNPRLHLERFPAYAPELNPDEMVWAHLKGKLSNGCPDSIDNLMENLTRLARKARRSSTLIRSFVNASELPLFL
jgi:transposase